MIKSMTDTLQQYDYLFQKAYELFILKQSDYGQSWTIMRPSSLTDQMYIKAARIRSIEEKQGQMIEDDIQDDYFGLINYGVMSLIQCDRQHFDLVEDYEWIRESYTAQREQVRALMIKKNHDYGEAWRAMRISSITDLILMKLYRIKSIETSDEHPKVSESVESGYADIINYSIFALILMGEDRSNLRQ